jgi:type VI secretion system secreted protein Hcp
MAVDMFLKIKGDPYAGESADKKHKGEIDVISFSWGESNSGSSGYGGGAGAGKVNMQDFTFTMKTCKASPNLALACATGEHIPEATLTCRKAGKEQQEFLIVKFTDLLISSYHVGSGPGEELPVESVSFNFAKIEVSYSPQKADGTLDAAVKMNYNVQENAAA